MARHALLLAALMLTCCTTLFAQTNTTPDAARITGLIDKLGSENFAERERAKVELEKVGPAALDALRKAAESDDLETSRRAGELVRKIEEKSANANLLAPKTIHLKLTDVSVAEALVELEKQSGYPIQIGGDQAALKNRKITIDTGATTFWQAFDQLCTKAGLIEQEAQPVVPQPRVELPAIRRNIRVQPQVLPINPLPIQKQALPVLPVVPPNANGVAPQLQAVLPVPIQPNVKVAPIQAPAIQIIQAMQAAQAKAQIQIQAQPAIAPIQFNPNGRVSSKPGIFVASGTPKSVPTSYSGAVRLRLLPAPGTAQPGELAFMLDVDAEPRLQNFTLAAAPQIEKAIDDQGQALEVAMGTPNDPNVAGNAIAQPFQRLVILQNGYQQIRQQAVVRFKAGEKPAKTIKELTGVVSAQALTQTEPVVVMQNILKSAGQTEKANGYLMQVHSVEKLANGDVKIDVTLEGDPNQNGIPGVQVFQGGAIQIRGQIQINGNVIINGTSMNNTSLPNLVDANGKNFRLSSTPGRRVNINNGRVSSQITLVFSPGPGQAEADRLVLSGQRTATFQVPFAFKDVPIE